MTLDKDIKDVLMFVLWGIVGLALFFLFSGNPDVWDLLLKAAKEKLK